MALDNTKNFAKVTLSTGYTSAATTVVLAAGNGALLPSVNFNAVWWDSTLAVDPADDPNVEVVRVTNIATDTLTITRAQEGTSATNKNTAGHIYKMIAGITAKVINTDMAAVANLTASGSNVIAAGSVGLAGVTPNVSLDTSGAVATRFTNVVLANGTNSNIAIGNATAIYITGPTAGFALGGFANPFDGRLLTVWNGTSQIMTANHLDAGSAAANKIFIPGASNAVSTHGFSIMQFIYNGVQSNWIAIIPGVT